MERSRTDTRVAVLGTGVMGSGMARNLLRAGFEVCVWNRTREKTQSLVDAGARATGSPAAAVEGADICLTVLSDGAAVEEVMVGGEGALSALPGGSVWVQMSTIGVAATEHLYGLAKSASVAFVDAPVLGSRIPAEKGELVVLGSGPEDVRPRVQPLLDAVGHTTLWLGRAGAGSKLKLVVNNWIFGLVIGLAESVALARALEIDPRLFLSALTGSAVDSPYAHQLGLPMIDDDYSLNFPLRHAHKDASLVYEAARAAGIELPLNATELGRFAEALSMGLGEKDMATVYATYERDAPAGPR